MTPRDNAKLLAVGSLTPVCCGSVVPFSLLCCWCWCCGVFFMTADLCCERLFCVVVVFWMLYEIGFIVVVVDLWVLLKGVDVLKWEGVFVVDVVRELCGVVAVVVILISFCFAIFCGGWEVFCVFWIFSDSSLFLFKDSSRSKRGENKLCFPFSSPLFSPSLSNILFRVKQGVFLLKSKEISSPSFFSLFSLSSGPSPAKKSASPPLFFSSQEENLFQFGVRRGVFLLSSHTENNLFLSPLSSSSSLCFSLSGRRWRLGVEPILFLIGVSFNPALQISVSGIGAV